MSCLSNSQHTLLWLFLEWFPELTLSSVGVTDVDLSTETSWRTGCYYKKKICKMFQILVTAKREKKRRLIKCQSSIVWSQFQPQERTCGSLCLIQDSWSEDENMCHLFLEEEALVKWQVTTVTLNQKEFRRKHPYLHFWKQNNRKKWNIIKSVQN